MSMNPQVMARYQQLVSQGIPSMQAYAQAMHEQESSQMPTLGIQGLGTPSEMAGLGGTAPAPQQNVSAPVYPGAPDAPVTAPMSNPKSAQQPMSQAGNNPPPQQGPTSAQTNGTPMRDNASSDYPGRQSAAPGEGQTGDDATKGPKQPPSGGPGGAPAQASDSAGPQAGAYPGIPPAARNEQRFGYDPTQDSPGSWASRVFMEGLKDAGTNLYDPIMSGSPWGRFLQSRYTPDLESRLILGEMNGKVGAGGEAQFAHDTLSQMAQGGGSPAGGGAFSDLASAAGALSRYGVPGSDMSGLDPNQALAIGRMANDIPGQSNAILGGLRGASGGFGMQYAQSLLNNLGRQYQNDPSQNPTSGFMAAALSKLGIH